LNKTYLYSPRNWLFPQRPFSKSNNQSASQIIPNLNFQNHKHLLTNAKKVPPLSLKERIRLKSIERGPNQAPMPGLYPTKPWSLGHPKAEPYPAPQGLPRFPTPSRAGYRIPCPPAQPKAARVVRHSFGRVRALAPDLAARPANFATLPHRCLNSPTPAQWRFGCHHLSCMRLYATTGAARTDSTQVKGHVGLNPRLARAVIWGWWEFRGLAAGRPMVGSWGEFLRV
jgi:hypothetical protein